MRVLTEKSCPGLASHISVICFCGLIAFLLLSLQACSVFKLDRESNCLNENTSCFKTDNTKPVFVSSTPAVGSTVSRMPPLTVIFSEELKNPKPSDVAITGIGAGQLAINSITKVAANTYEFMFSPDTVVNGNILLDFTKFQDYNGNAVNYSLPFTGNVDIEIKFDETFATNPGYHKGVSNGGGYQTTVIRWHHEYDGDPGNNWDMRVTTGAVDCDAGTSFFTGTSLAHTSVVMQTFDRLTHFGAGAGNYRVVVCVTNAAQNKKGIGSLIIRRDDTQPTASHLPVSDEYNSAKAVTFSCSDNADKIAYKFTEFSGYTGNPADPADPTPDPDFDVAGEPAGTSLLYSSALTTNNPANPTRTKYKYRCIDIAGNKSTVEMATYVIDTTLPEVNISLDSSYRNFVTTNVGGYTSTTIRFTTNQIAGLDYNIVRGGTGCAAQDGTSLIGGVQLTNSQGSLHTWPINASMFLVGANDVRVCVKSATNKWGTASLTITRDDTIPTVTPSAGTGSYGAIQTVNLTCSPNADKVAITNSTLVGSVAPTPPNDPNIDASGNIIFGTQQDQFITPESSVTILKWQCITKSGNRSVVDVSSTATYTVDSILPTVTVVSNERTALGTGGFTSSQLIWNSSRAGLTYRIMRDTTDCINGTQLGTDQTTPATVNNVVQNVTTALNLANFPDNSQLYNIRICVFNFINKPGYSTSGLSIMRDNNPPVFSGNINITSSTAGTYTLSWADASDADSGIYRYQIYRGDSIGFTPTLGSPDYTTLTTSATFSVPVASNLYYFKVFAADNAGNLTQISEGEVASKPSITLALKSDTDNTNFTLSDGAATAPVTAGTTTSNVAWTTTLGAGAIYNFSISGVVAGKNCAIHEKQFGTLTSNLTITVSCVTGYNIGQNFNTAASAKLSYRLFQGKNTALAGEKNVLGANDSTTPPARFNYPEYLTHLNGALYIADTNNYKVRKINLSDNMVSTLAGDGNLGAGTEADNADGTCLSARFGQTMGITTDGINLYVADFNSGRIRKISNVNGTCRIMTLAGTGEPGYAEGSAGTAKFHEPRQIVANQNYIFVADNQNHRIRRISLATGNVDTLAGDGNATNREGTGIDAGVAHPIGVTLLGNVLYVSSEHNRILAIDINSRVVTFVAGDGSSGYLDSTGSNSKFNGAYSLTTDGVDLYIVEVYNHVVRRIEIAKDYRVTTLAGASGHPDDTTGVVGVNARFNVPHGITTDGRSLYVANHTAHTITKLTDNGLVAYWPLNGSVAEFSSDGTSIKNGTISGSVTSTTGRHGETDGAMNFAGTDDYITATGDKADTHFDSNDFSIAFWIKPAVPQVDLATARDYDIVTNLLNHYDFAIRYHNEVSSDLTEPPYTPGQIAFIRFNGAQTPYCLSGISISDGKFHHVTAQKSGQRLHLFIDGKRVCSAQDTVVSISLNNVGPVRIGARPGYPNNDFTGALADMRIYKRAISEGEIHELAQDASSDSAITGTGFSTGATGLLAHYMFNQGVEDLPSGPLGGALSISGPKTAVFGKDAENNSAVFYNGTTNYYTGNGLGLPLNRAHRTICGWFSPASYKTAAMLVSYGNGSDNNAFGLIMYNDTHVGLTAWNNDVLANSTMPLNTWSHLCGTFDGTSATVYLNGKVAATGSFATAMATVTGSIIIGKNTGADTNNFFPGKIDDVRIYDNALSAYQIGQLAAQIPNGLAAHYTMSGNTDDSSGHNRHGSPTAVTQTTDRFGLNNNAYHFSNARINASEAGLPAGRVSRSVCAWIRPTGYPTSTSAITDYGTIVVYGGAVTPVTGTKVWLGLHQDNKILFDGQDLGTTFNYKFPLHVWSHLCGVYDNSTPAQLQHVYVNGAELPCSGACSATPWNTQLSGNGIVIGQDVYASAAAFQGDIDEVRIYTRALTAQEVLGLAGYHPMQVTTFNASPGSSSMRLFLQAENSVYSAGACSGGTNCVSDWSDSSGINNHLSQSTPASRPVYHQAGINGKPAVKFVRSSGTYLERACDASINSVSQTIFMVYKETAPGGNDGIFQNGAGTPPGGDLGKLIYFVVSGSGSGRTPALFDLNDNTLSVRAQDPYFTTNENVLMTLDFDGSSRTLYKSGFSQTAVGGNSGEFSCGSNPVMNLGRYLYAGPVAGSEFYEGFLGDFIYFDRVLNNFQSVYGAPYTDRQVVECYLSSKYAISLAAGAVCP